MPSDTAARNDAMVRAFLAAWERRDTEHIMSCWADDGVYHAVALQPILGSFRMRIDRDLLALASQGVAEEPSRAQLELVGLTALNPLSRHLANARPASSRRIMSAATDDCATWDFLLYDLLTERSLHQRRTACNEG
jgi:SnoaL-like domain